MKIKEGEIGIKGMFLMQIDSSIVCEKLICLKKINFLTGLWNVVLSKLFTIDLSLRA